MTTKMAAIKTSAMTANRWPRPPSAIRPIQRGTSATERGFFLSSLAAQCGQASHRHASTFRKNGVATSCSQAGHFAIENTCFADAPNVPRFFLCVNGTDGHLYAPSTVETAPCVAVLAFLALVRTYSGIYLIFISRTPWIPFPLRPS